MALRIFNTLTRQIEVFSPLRPGQVGMYVCGMTIYDYCHIGHARMMLAFDLVQRWLKTSGYQVTYVRNITDIDDKIIRRAVERGITIKALTEEMTAAMHEDIQALGIEPPDFEPRATQYVPHMLSLIGQLEEKGLAYQAANGDVNYAVRKFPHYGKLSGKSIDQLRAGERIAVDASKQDPLDFVLWKAAKAEEPAEVKYPSVYGPGRPGWHIECSAMSCAILGEEFDIHGGGLDLQFPHHENEIAQSEGAHNKKFARYWMHNGFLNIDDKKMSKSLGNFFTIRDVLKVYEGETLRFFLLKTHYRSPFNYSDTALDEARQGLRRLYTALGQAAAEGGERLSAVPNWQHPYAERFKAAMDDDFNTPIAVAVLFEIAADINRQPTTELINLLRLLGAVLGILQQVPEVFLRKGMGQSNPLLNNSEIEAYIMARTEAKRDRNYAEADRIRTELAAKGIVLKDSPSGTTWIRD